MQRREMPGDKADGAEMAVQPRRTRTRWQSRDCGEMRRSEVEGSRAGEAERTSAMRLSPEAIRLAETEGRAAKRSQEPARSGRKEPR